MKRALSLLSCRLFWCVCVASLALNKGGAEMINFRNSSIALSDFAASAPMQIRKQATLGFFALLGSAGAANNTSSRRVSRAHSLPRHARAASRESSLCEREIDISLSAEEFFTLRRLSISFCHSLRAYVYNMQCDAARRENSKMPQPSKNTNYVACKKLASR